MLMREVGASRDVRARPARVLTRRRVRRGFWLVVLRAGQVRHARLASAAMADPRKRGG